MTRIFSVVTIILCLLGSSVNAQLSIDGNKKYSHHLGLQANPLLRQIINFGNAPAIENPYLLKYALRKNANRTELLFGLGFSYNSDEVEDGITSDFLNLDFRVGYAKKVLLGKRFEAGFGLDLVVNNNNSKTVNIQAFSGGGGGFVDSTITTTKNFGLQYGLGPQLTLDYYITNSIKIGTEATFYFLTGASTFTLDRQRFRSNFQGGGLEETNSADRESLKFMDFRFQIPVALFLTVIF